MSAPMKMGYATWRIDTHGSFDLMRYHLILQLIRSKPWNVQ